MTQQAFITPSLLSWAIERARIDLDTLSKKLHKQPEHLEEWKNGEKKPTFKQAQKLAHVLHIPFGYLFLETPPKEELPIPDLRTIGSTQPKAISAEFRDLLNDIKRKQAWYREFSIENDLDKFKFFGAFNLSDRVEDVATSIRKALGINKKLRLKCRDKDAYLKLLTQQTENLGILVMRNSVVGSNTSRSLKVSEFRGFAIADEYAPLIFLNSSDANSAKIFTLTHELAHLWLAESGISAIDLEETHDNKTEQFCNAVSAEILVPSVEFKSEWKTSLDIEINASSTADIFKVSTFVVARKAYDVGLIAKSEFTNFYREESARFEKARLLKRSQKSGGGNPFANTWTRNGKRFSTAVATSAIENRLLLRDAGAYLNLNPNKVLRFADSLGVR